VTVYWFEYRVLGKVQCNAIDPADTLHAAKGHLSLLDGTAFDAATFFFWLFIRSAPYKIQPEIYQADCSSGLKIPIKTTVP
jgi:hypothetical protein